MLIGAGVTLVGVVIVARFIPAPAADVGEDHDGSLQALNRRGCRWPTILSVANGSGDGPSESSDEPAMGNLSEGWSTERDSSSASSE